MSLLEMPATVLYKQGAKHIQKWKIFTKDNTIVIEHGILNGAIQHHLETIERGKGGRSLYQQLVSRVESRVNKQKLQGYKESVEEALEGPSNALGFVQPMLAQPLKKVNVDISDAWVQYKYDGNRCLITKQNGINIAYSRRGKIIDTISHITDNIDLKEGETIDGELYAHGATLQEIVSWVRKDQPGTKRVQFHAYDFVAPFKYFDRLLKLYSISMGGPCHIVPTQHISQLSSLNTTFNEAREQGYEGLILRVGDTGYEVNKRSKSLIKVKKFLDDEFEVMDIRLSEKGIPVIDCLGFKVTAPGNSEEKYNYYVNKEKYIGQMLTVEFSSYTKDQIPFHPIANRFRID